MTTRPGTRQGSIVGYSLGLLGAAAFAVSCFLPFFTVRLQGRVGSLYNDFSHAAGALASLVGTWLCLFVGPAVVAFAAIVGLRPDPPGWTPVALVTATGVWSATMVGILLLTPHGYSLGVGYWCLLLSLGVAVSGAILVVVSPRTRVGPEDRDTTAA